ncbi:MAG: class I SAM-dependent methyltransferase [Chloroflexota bacterium]|nr:class I SAM-dependent methyltransferase [Chloroflexota bacterium]
MHKSLTQALKARSSLISDNHAAAIRLFNGFYEGYPNLVVDLYARTLILFGYEKSSPKMMEFMGAAQNLLLEQLPWVNCVVHKQRFAPDRRLRRGVLRFGDKPAEKIEEHGIWYAIDSLMNQDASFYLDTRNLRKWLLDNASGWKVMNTFAYTGSLGVAALAGGAARVIQSDRNRKFLELARTSGMLSHLDIGKMKLRTANFFTQVAQLKHNGELFDCLIIDPPFFSSTKKGNVDLVNDYVRIINKVRPLVKDGGRLIAINNALFLSGAEYMSSLEQLCADGYLSIETIIPVPQDITGYSQTIVDAPPRDPAPFNHPTKIAILGVRRK